MTNIDRYETNVLRKQLVVTVVMLMEMQAKTWLIGLRVFENRVLRKTRA